MSDPESAESQLPVGTLLVRRQVGSDSQPLRPFYYAVLPAADALGRHGYDVGCADAVRRVAEAVVGPERVLEEGLPLAAAEDFAFFAREVPSAYFFLGAGEPGHDTPGCHHPDFDFDDDLLPTGIKMFLGLVRDRTAVERA